MLDFLFYSIMPFLFILGFCITIHEIGHFLFAKLFGIPVEKFSIGYGPPILRKRIGETDFRIAYFPLGGYVKMAGEEEGVILKKNEGEAESDRAQNEESSPTPISSSQPGFYEAPVYKRILVVFSGPFFNIVSAFVVLLCVFALYGLVVNPYMNIIVDKDSYYASIGLQTGDSITAINHREVKTWEELWTIATEEKEEVILTVVRNTEEVAVTALLSEDSAGLRPLVPPILGPLKQNGPADKAGMFQGDRILEIDQNEITSWEEMVSIVRLARKKPLNITWQHGDSIKTASITPASFYDPISRDTIGQIGVFIPYGRQYLSIDQILVLGFQRTGELISRMLHIFYQLITRQIPARQLGGPIAIFKLSAESAQWGFEHLLGLLVIISINLGLINLFPIPALDGGHIVIALIEAIRRKRFSRRTRGVIQQVGYAIIFLLIIFVTFNDITR